MDKRQLETSELYQRCDPALFDFETTADLEELGEVIGQPRAVEALHFGMGIGTDGHNIYAMGPTGTRKRELVQELFQRRAKSERVPNDWCYVNNFDQPAKPRAISLPPGMGIQFRNGMEHATAELSTAMSAAFESEEYQTRQQSIAEEFQERQSEALDELQERVAKDDLALIRTPGGFVFAPVHDGNVLSPEEIQQMSEERRRELERKVDDYQQDLQRILRQVPTWQRERRERLNQLDREMAEFAVSGIIDELKEKYAGFPEVLDYLEAVQKDVIENAQAFMPSEQQQPQMPGFLQMLAGGAGVQDQQPVVRRYQVNVVVDHSDDQGAPVIYEDNPSYQNLIGRVEHQAQMGALITDFSLIKGGALHEANGGYLILDVQKVLTEPYAWEGLKRALQSKDLRIESLGQRLSLISTVSLEPEAIPLNVRVALVGDERLYYALWQLDPDFRELFKVAADFAGDMDRTDQSQRQYAQLIASLVRQHDLRPLDRTGVARVIEQSARMVGDTAKLSTQVRNVADLLQEASYWAGEADADVVTADHVQKAIDAQIFRADRIRERMQEQILRETILISTEGTEVGQVNGLSVISLGNFWFGRPTRITAQTRLGNGQVVDIEREVELGGPLHSKGVLILSGFVGARYAEETPLSLSASLVFEQSYGGVDGDSASSAELYALLSAISEVPIKQSYAVTGSVNQHGHVQAIGGVNVKIEGFFDVCKARGLTGEQGVLIPSSNVKHLMLRQDVRDAVDAGKFQIFAVDTIDQGIEILTGIPAGEPDEEGNYPEGTVNYRVKQRLAELAEKRRKYGASGKEGEA
ncbi:MAG: Lon protease family protein [Anaerolineae bacterium]|jgi:lon-related putative ATP-dependent protease